jgi:hypothetical protein
VSISFELRGHFAKAERYTVLAIELASILADSRYLFVARLELFSRLSRAGKWNEAEQLWELLDAMGRNWSRLYYQPGEAELCFAEFQFWLDRLTDDHLTRAEDLAQQGHGRGTSRALHALRGKWSVLRGEWDQAAEHLHDAVRLAHEVGMTDQESETWLTLVRFHLGTLAAPDEDAARLAKTRDPAHLPLAELWRAIGDQRQAAIHALAAYQKAWGDGEPHVHRHSLLRATALLRRLGAEVPTLPPYDPANDPKAPWEHAVEAVIERLRTETASQA